VVPKRPHRVWPLDLQITRSLTTVANLARANLTRANLIGEDLTGALLGPNPPGVPPGWVITDSITGELRRATT